MEYTIEYKGKTNLDFNLYWDTRDFELGTGLPNIDQNSVAGINGTLLDFNRAYKSFEQKFTFYAVFKDMDASECKRQLTNWLLKEPGYAPLRFSQDPNYIFNAAPNPNSIIKFPAYNKRFAKVEITFLFKPFKYSVLGRENPYTLTAGKSYQFYNPEQWRAYPFIYIQNGSGDITIKINDNEYKLLAVDGDIYIDCAPEKSIVYHDLTVQGSRNRKAIFPDHKFPYFEPNLNHVTINGSFDKATITPNWRCLC